jgi:predicted RNA-binding Zn-ribbon protein involved in translation (DUF1610 family)
MALVIACNSCGAPLRVRDEYVGRLMTCPKCGEVVRAVDRPPAEPPGVSEPVSDAEPRPSAAVELFAPCPRCGSRNAERVVWTVWGSLYGPALLNHVHCLGCGYGYNGRTGRSNFLAAAAFVLVPLLLILAILGGLGFWLWRRLN